jgi:hypothetical protein
VVLACPVEKDHMVRQQTRDGEVRFFLHNILVRIKQSVTRTPKIPFEGNTLNDSVSSHQSCFGKGDHIIS